MFSSLASVLHSSSYCPKAWLLKPGRPSNALRFVTQGAAGNYYPSANRLHCAGFFFAGEAMYLLPSFYGVQALGSCTVETLAGEALIGLDRQLRIIQERQYLAAEARFRLLQLRPVDRYRYLLEHEPRIIQQVSNTQVASYLGISLESLSRLKVRV